MLPANIETIKVLDQKIDNIKLSELLKIIDSTNIKDDFLSIATINPEFLVLSHQDKKFAQALQKFDIKVADGYGIIFMTKLFYKKPIAIRITGVELSNKLFSYANKNHKKVVLLGASEKNAQLACSNLKRNYPMLKVKCISGGTIDPHNVNDGLIKEIKDYKPSILLVGLGCPKQEYFILNHAHKIGANVAVGVGGTIDFIAGSAKRAPRLMQNIGLEWLWRLFLEPKRFRRIFNATIVFPIMFIRSLFKKH